MLELWAAILILAVLLFVLTVVVRVEIGDLKQSLSLANADIVNLQNSARCLSKQIDCIKGLHDYKLSKIDGTKNDLKEQCSNCYDTKYLTVTKTVEVITMTDDIREKAEAFIKWVNEDSLISSGFHTSLINSKEFKALKAALRPSRGEIADYLECCVKEKLNDFDDMQYLKYAIEELRK